MKDFRDALSLVCFGVLLAVPTGSALANDGVESSAVCPPTVAAGTPLVIEVTVSTENGVTLNRFMTALASGSRRNTLGMLGVYGPFAYNLPTPVTINPGEGQTFAVTVVGSVPGTLVGQMVGASASIVDSEGGISDTASCVVEVTP